MYNNFVIHHNVFVNTIVIHPKGKHITSITDTSDLHIVFSDLYSDGHKD